MIFKEKEMSRVSVNDLLRAAKEYYRDGLYAKYGKDFRQYEKPTEYIDLAKKHIDLVGNVCRRKHAFMWAKARIASREFPPHMNHPLDIARNIAHRRCDELYRSIWKAVYLHEVGQRLPLSDAGQTLLTSARAEISEAIGLTPTR
jgi:hypothetical protein